MLWSGPERGADEDAATIGLEFSDVSIGRVHHWGNGHKGVVREWFEVFCERKVLRVDSWRMLVGNGFKGFEKMALSRQDKGRAVEVKAFLN